MKALSKYRDPVLVLLTLFGLLAAGVLAAMGGVGTLGDRENLDSTVEAPSLTDWHFDKDAEDYLAKHVPYRRSLVAVDKTVSVLTGRRTELQTWPVAGTYVERPVEDAADKVAIRLANVRKFADRQSAPWYVLIPPTHGWLMRERMTPLMAQQYETETAAYALLGEDEHTVRMPYAFLEDPDAMYYRTDHHWTLKGAYQAYLALGERLGYEPLALSDFRISRYEGFHGTTLSRSGLPMAVSDTLVCAEPASPVRLTVLSHDGVSLETYDQLIFPEKADTVDGYGVYLQDNYGLLLIENDAAPEGTLAVYKDSFANCLLPLLSAHYSRIIAVDLRYMVGGYSKALRDAKALFGPEDLAPDAILFLYSLSDF